MKKILIVSNFAMEVFPVKSVFANLERSVLRGSWTEFHTPLDMCEMTSSIMLITSNDKFRSFPN